VTPCHGLVILFPQNSQLSQGYQNSKKIRLKKVMRNLLRSSYVYINEEYNNGEKEGKKLN